MTQYNIYTCWGAGWSRFREGSPYEQQRRSQLTTSLLGTQQIWGSFLPLSRLVADSPHVKLFSLSSGVLRWFCLSFCCVIVIVLSSPWRHVDKLGVCGSRPGHLELWPRVANQCACRPNNNNKKKNNNNNNNTNNNNTMILLLIIIIIIISANHK